jgi:acyl-CoA synthetase (AMP-forming)/AMP-acid ligase II
VAPIDPAFRTDILVSEMQALLPRYMVPGTVVVLDTLPRSPNGKFDRSLIREEYST